MASILQRIVRRLRGPQYGFFGDYGSWAAASGASKGYDHAEILEKVRAATLKVKRGEAAYERDSVTFDEKQYSWPVLTALIDASKESGRLNVLDFGGSLGSSYFQNRDKLAHLKELKWNIVEQGNFIEVGQKELQDKELRFYNSIEKCLAENRPDVILLSSVIQYLEKPYEMLEKIVGLGIKSLVFDRTAFASRDRLTVQKVRPGIYSATYPAWFLDEQKFLGVISKKYELVSDFESLAGKIQIHKPEETAYEKGFIFSLR